MPDGMTIFQGMLPPSGAIPVSGNPGAGVGVGVGVGVSGFVSEHEEVVPPFKPVQDHVHSVEPLTLFALVPALQL